MEEVNAVLSTVGALTGTGSMIGFLILVIRERRKEFGAASQALQLALTFTSGHYQSLLDESEKRCAEKMNALNARIEHLERMVEPPR